MQNEKLLSRGRVKILNILTKLFFDDTNIYHLDINRADIRVQGYYNSILITKLIKRDFNLSVSQHGYIHLTKTIAGIELRFTFTD